MNWRIIILAPTRNFNSTLGDMISEGFAEFLALHITRVFISDSLYRDDLQMKARTLRDFKPIPAASIRSKTDYRNRELYVYYYAPLIFSAIEKEIGEEKTWEWMRALLQSPAVFTNYAFFEQTLDRVVKNKARFEELRQKYFAPERSLQHALATLKLPGYESPASVNQKPAAKTYYYFFFSRPRIDAGSSQNKVIKHTEVLEITGTPDDCKRWQNLFLNRLAMNVKMRVAVVLILIHTIRGKAHRQS